MSKYLRPLAVLGSSAYQVVLPEASSFSTLAATGLPSFFMRSTVLCDAGGVPQLERAKLPVEAGLHRLVDFDDGVGDFGHAVGGVGPEIGEHVPEEEIGLVFRGRDQRAQALGQIVDVLRHFEGRELGPLLLAIFEGLPVEGETLFAVGTLLLLVEAALGLVAQPLAIEHLGEERGAA